MRSPKTLMEVEASILESAIQWPRAQPWRNFYPSACVLLEVQRLIRELKVESVFYLGLADAALLELLVSSELKSVIAWDHVDYWGASAIFHSEDDEHKARLQADLGGTPEWLEHVVFKDEGFPRDHYDLFVQDLALNFEQLSCVVPATCQVLAGAATKRRDQNRYDWHEVEGIWIGRMKMAPMDQTEPLV